MLANPECRRVMFVGEDQEIWPDLLKSSARENWRMTFAHAGDEALVALDEQEFDAVITDLSLRGMTGPELLHEVRQRRPEIWRFLRGRPQVAHESTGWAGAAHQFIEGSGAEEIESRLAQAFRREFWMPGPVAENLLATCPLLPSPPQVFYQILDALSSPSATLEQIGDIIERDPPMSAKILKLVNSAVFSLQVDVTRPSEAVMYLGMETTKAMVLMAHTVSSFQKVERAEFSFEQLLRHSYSTARRARWITQLECPRGKMADQAFTAGLLHDIGKFLLAGNRSEAYARAIQHARKNRISLRQAEFDFFGADHAELGGCLLAAWGLPQPIVEAVALHHAPRSMGDGGFCPATAVHAANILAHEHDGSAQGFHSSEFDLDYLRASGCEDSITGWRQTCAFRE